jgi:prevent-host-death family protein
LTLPHNRRTIRPVSIALVTTRKLSQQPARVLARVKKSGPQIITVNGQPTADLVAATRAARPSPAAKPARSTRQPAA